MARDKTRNMKLQTTLIMIVCFSSMLIAVSRGAEPIDIGSRLEPLIDDYLIARRSGSLELRLHHPIRQRDAITLDRPWEGNNSAYATVLKFKDQFFFYYRGTALALTDKLRAVHFATTCVMTSKDGIHWDRPDLGFVKREGWEKNNIILTFDPDCGIELGKGQSFDDGNDLLSGKKVPFTAAAHNFTPFIDANPDCPADEKFKALGGLDHRTLYAFKSPDGLHWSMMQKEAVIVDGMMDSQNLAFWDPIQKCYYAYYRDFKNKKGDPRTYQKHQFSLRDRDVRFATSKDFIHWTAGEYVDWQPERYTQLYTSQTQLYPGAPHLRIGFPMRYVPSRSKFSELNQRIAKASNYYATVYTDTGLITSRDGRRFQVWPEALIRPGPTSEQWYYGFGGTALNLFETPSSYPGGATEWSFYVQDHGSWFGTGVTYNRYSIRKDGFVSASSPAAGGSFVTRPLRFQGTQLRLNYSTSAAGSIRVEIQDAATENPLPGFALEDCPEVFGDSIGRGVEWENEADLVSLAGKSVRLRFELTDADLYSLQFTSNE